MLKPISEAVSPVANLPNVSTNINNQPNGTAAQNNIETNAVKSKIEKVISESPDLVTALEAVGAMYGIPASSIISEDNATCVRVENDTIIAPPIENPSGQTKVIMQAIGSVLDYISQRIDDKLNSYQASNIANGQMVDKMAYLSNGPKGKCVGIYNADDGAEIHAYDSGAVDMPNTPAAQAKVAELRATNTIPTFDPSVQFKRPGDEYFNDEDVAADIDMNATSDTTPGEANLEVNSIPDEIQESAYHVNMIAKMGDTTHLGYDLLQKHGFDFVKPIDAVYVEAAEVETKEEEPDAKEPAPEETAEATETEKEATPKESKDKSKEAPKKKAPKKEKSSSGKRISAEDIKYMKFDNSNIINAVKYFNDARAGQAEGAEKLDTKKFLNDPSFKKGVEALNKQFDCNINVRFFADKSEYENVATPLMRDIKRNLTISKSKGFQLNGQPISIYVYNRFLESNNSNSKLFGQQMVSIFLHEIFHNISLVMREESAKMALSLTAALNAAGSTDDVKKKRIIMQNYVDTIDAVSKSKLIDKVAKKKMVKQLVALSMVEGKESATKELANNVKRSENADQYIDSLIKKYKKSVKNTSKPGAGQYITWSLIAAGGIIGTLMTGGTAIPMIVGAAGVAGLLSTATLSLAYMNAISKYSSAKLYEEYYCDLFASMYQLPVTFFVGSSKEKYTPNEFKTEKLNELAKLETQLHKNVFSSYPTPLERCHASVRTAKTLLQQKDIDPEVKKYCKWIVDNFSDIHKTEISTFHNSTTFNPEEAENLDKHLTDLIDKNNVTITESFIQWLNSDEVVM